MPGELLVEYGGARLTLGRRSNPDIGRRVSLIETLFHLKRCKRAFPRGRSGAARRCREV